MTNSTINTITSAEFIAKVFPTAWDIDFIEDSNRAIYTFVEEKNSWFDILSSQYVSRETVIESIIEHDNAVVAVFNDVETKHYKLVSENPQPSKSEGCEVAHASKSSKVNSNKGGSTMNKTKIYLINTKESKRLNAFCEKNADKYSFIALGDDGQLIKTCKQTMQNVMFASYIFDEDTKAAISRRVSFQNYRPGTAYRCMFLDLRDSSVVTFYNKEEIRKYDILRKTQYANNSFDKTSKLVQEETERWLKLASKLTNGIITPDTKLHGEVIKGTWNSDRQGCLDKMNLYLTDVDFDSYTTGHLEPRMKSNAYRFTEDYRFFDLTFEKGFVSCHEEEREAENYVLTDLEVLKNFCHVLTCRRYGIEFNDSLGNGGRVTREASQGVINYTELAELVNVSDDREFYIEALKTGKMTVEDIYSELVGSAQEAESVTYFEY